MSSWRETVERVTGRRIARAAPLPGGCIAEVWRADLGGGRSVVAKVAAGGGTLEVEGFMLGHLAERSPLPVPRVLHAEGSLLLLEFVQGESRFSAAAEAHAASLLAELHARPGPCFGFTRDTLIGPLRQPNPRTGSWVAFFREQRLLLMADVAARSGHLPPATNERVRRLAEDLGSLIDEPECPSLLHGDVWTTNVLARGDEIAAFLDPAIYWGHPEAELAFITLFDTFGDTFFERYNRLRPIRGGFFERRRHIYNLYPLLVHTALFGPGYASQVSENLRRLGY